MHVNLGAPYESIIEKAIKKGYASSQTEVLRSALLQYDEHFLNKEYKQEYIEKIKKIESGKFIKIKSTDELWSE